MSEKDSLLNEFLGIIGNADKQDDYEIEARIGDFYGDKFTSNTSSKQFFRVLEHFLKLDDIFVYVSHEVSQKTPGVVPTKPDIITDIYYNYNEGNRRVNLRESFIDIPDSPHFFSTKKNVANVDLKDYFTRFSMSKEVDLKENPMKHSIPPQAVRIKKRWSFAIKDSKMEHPLQPFRVDMTYVTGYTINERGKKDDKPRFEIELEVVNKPITTTDQLWDGVRYIIKLLQQTEYPVTKRTVKDVTEDFNNLFRDEIKSLEKTMRENSRTPNWRFNFNNLINIVNKPVNLKLDALFNPNDLAITDKADGERKLLLIRPDGGYLLSGPNDVSLYLQSRNDSVRYYIKPKIAEFLNNTIIDGELVLLNSGEKEYLAFDLLVYKGEDVRNLPFSERIDKLNEIKNKINITFKKYYMPDDGEFYERTNKLLEDIPDKPYGNDGIILNNINDIYTHRENIFEKREIATSKKTVSKITVEKLPSVYKWKPPELLTIDFKIKVIDPDTLEVYVKNDKSPQSFKFVGTRKYPFNGLVKVDSLELNGNPLSDNQVVEMKWNSELKNFVPFRIRFDREQPNKFSTVKSVWEDIMNPISEDTIRGTDLKLMRKYHNLEKDLMIKKCEQKHILDIGSGRGGDLHKWKNLESVILAIEPSIDNLNEFSKRLVKADYVETGYPNQYKYGKTVVTLHQAGGQDTETIIKLYKSTYGRNVETQSINCITMFNVLTFFFEKESLLDSLINTIDSLLHQKGTFMGMVMDGNKVKELLGNDKEFKPEGEG